MHLGDIKFRSDLFDVLAPMEVVMRIQEQVQLNAKDVVKDLDNITTMEQANQLAQLYLQIAMDEGYRHAIEELQKDIPYKTIEVKPRVKGATEYVEIDEMKDTIKKAKRRIASKRQLKRWEKDHGDDKYEQFTLCMIVHTGYEAGYLKGTNLEESCKIVNPESGDMIYKLMQELIPVLKEEEDA